MDPPFQAEYRSVMSQMELVPVADEAQRAVTRSWSAFVARRPLPDEGAEVVGDRSVRSLVRDSWHRSVAAQVAPSLASAPVALEPSALAVTCEESDWFGTAHRAVAQQLSTFAGDGHIVTLFDAEGSMLAAEGDPHALNRMAEINFAPGGNWAETRVGTNGPGTALATGAPTHIVGAEHFCERWQAWHCAAVPVRDPATLRVIGAVDISGFREQAHPHTLSLALALGLAIEQTLAARELARRYLMLESFHALVARYPGDSVLAIDRGGRVLTHSPAFPADAAHACAHLVRTMPFVLTSDPAGAPLSLGPDRSALWFPVRQGPTVVGGCFIVPGGPLPRGSEGIAFERGEVRVYARRFFEAGAREMGRLRLEIDADVYDAMQAYHWPGNVRELKQVVRRVLNSCGGRITLQHLPHAIREAWAGATDHLSSPIDDEDARLMQVVRESRTMAEAAAKLQITRSTLYRRMERYGLKPKRVVGRQ
ncbi:MAG TPA: helix-turn-helix domain-containing protein [Gemmatimonadaceae bacterium]|nr:helix-turn-helix domain-containing protein [Gemmatimonadaceae bacterium]